MPIYEFSCPDCGESFEEILRNLEAIHSVVCPQCGNQQVHRKISTFASRIAGGNSSATGSSLSTCGPAST